MGSGVCFTFTSDLKHSLTGGTTIDVFLAHPDTEAPPRHRGRLLLIAGAATLVLAAIVLLWGASAYGSSLEAEERFLPGLQVAGIDVGDRTYAEVEAELTELAESWLDHTVLIDHPQRHWRVSPRELQAATDLDQVLATANQLNAEVSLATLTGVRWLGQELDAALELSLLVPEEDLHAFVDRVAGRIDRDPTDATARWIGGAATTIAHRDGEQVDRETFATTLREAFESRTEVVVPDSSVVGAEVTDVDVDAVLPTVQASGDATLDRAVELTTEEQSFPVTARELGGVPDVAPALVAALAGDGDAEQPPGGQLPLSIDEDAAAEFVAEVAAEADVAPRNATLDTSSGWVRVVRGAFGEAVDQRAATDDLLTALTGDLDAVALHFDPVEPAITSANYRQVLLVRQSDRRVYLYRDGEIIRDWPVAVGTGGSPTPTGTFVVGAKRFEPTWVNPAPDRWGRDMPARIGPGPNNPLGLRALNWNRPGGGDTLIRFHGTPNTGSIGRAASNGCVRMYNSDVIELYDLVGSGTTIVSLG